MQTKTDAQLLREYAGTGSEAAFGELVGRHADLVYSAALRQVIEPDLARDVAQSVFTDLARKAKSLSGDVLLVGWLYRSTRFAALSLLRNERRRQNRERQAMQLLDSPRQSSPDWDLIRPVLDDAMANLGKRRRGSEAHFARAGQTSRFSHPTRREDHGHPALNDARGERSPGRSRGSGRGARDRFSRQRQHRHNIYSPQSYDHD